jgi:transposase
VTEWQELHDGLKVFVAFEASDKRKGFNGLASMVRKKLKEDLRSGALFVFTAAARQNQAPSANGYANSPLFRFASSGSC